MFFIQCSAKMIRLASAFAARSATPPSLSKNPRNVEFGKRRFAIWTVLPGHYQFTEYPSSERGKHAKKSQKKQSGMKVHVRI
jgi:hypothetical protein